MLKPIGIAFDNLIDNSMPMSQYIIDYLKSDIDISTVEGKTSFALEAKKFLVKCQISCIQIY